MLFFPALPTRCSVLYVRNDKNMQGKTKQGTIFSMPVGQPLKFKTPEELQDKVNEYFADCDKREKPYTITGLALFLDTTRETLLDYEKRDAYTDTVKRAKQRVELAYEERLIEKGRSGDIFALKNFGWRDKQEQELSNPDGTLRPTVIELVGKDESKD